MIILETTINLLLIVFSVTNFYLAFWNLIQFHLNQKQNSKQSNQNTSQKLSSSKLYYIARTFPYYSLIIISIWVFTTCFNNFCILFGLI